MERQEGVPVGGRCRGALPGEGGGGVAVIRLAKAEIVWVLAVVCTVPSSLHMYT